MQILDVEQQLQEARERWETERGEVEVSVNAEDIAAVVASRTGIPVARMVESEAQKLARVEAKLHQRIVGQRDAIRAVANAIRRNCAGITASRCPIGSFL